MMNLLKLALRSLHKLGSDIAAAFLPSAIDEGPLRPIPIPPPASHDAEIRWINHECFYQETHRPPANLNRPPVPWDAGAWRSGNLAVAARHRIGMRRIAAGSPDLRGIRLLSGIGPILVDNPIVPGVPPPGPAARAGRPVLWLVSSKPKPAVPSARNEVKANDAADDPVGDAS